MPVELSSTPVQDAFLATCFTWAMTAAGAAIVFLVPSNMSQIAEKRLLDVSLGVASGIMMAASFFSLLQPAIELSADWGPFAWFPSSIGFIAGSAFVLLCDRLLPDPSAQTIHKDDDDKLLKADRMKARTWRRMMLLIASITCHNGPEGAVVGCAFSGGDRNAAIALTIGIGLQNFPEGAAVSLPLLRLGYSKSRAFSYGQLSGLVEPFFGVLAAYFIQLAEPLLPYSLAFASGCMIIVVLHDLMPETANNSEPNNDGILGFVAGFIVMMALDVGLG